MRKTTDKKITKEPTVQMKASQSMFFFMYMMVYIFLGIYLCYLKIVFGDLCRSDTLTHEKFTQCPNPIETISTTPSVPFYCKEDKKEYVKQLFVTNPNFIMEYAQNKQIYSDSGKDKVFKHFLLETSYVVFNIVNLLEDIPNWVIILGTPFIYMILFIFMAVFMWMMLSYYIFDYFLSDGHFFSKFYLGWFFGFLFWIFFMCYFGIFTVFFSVIYGLFRLIILIGKAKVRILDPSDFKTPGEKNITDDNTKPYGLIQFWYDMLKTSTSVHFLLSYTIFMIIGFFNKIISVAFVVVCILALLFNMGSISFIKCENLNKNGWTSFTENVDILNVMNTASENIEVAIPIKENYTKVTIAPSKPEGKENIQKTENVGVEKENPTLAETPNP